MAALTLAPARMWLHLEMTSLWMHQVVAAWIRLLHRKMAVGALKGLCRKMATRAAKEAVPVYNLQKGKARGKSAA
jgi:hypothetical protein